MPVWEGEAGHKPLTQGLCALCLCCHGVMCSLGRKSRGLRVTCPRGREALLVVGLLGVVPRPLAQSDGLVPGASALLQRQATHLAASLPRPACLSAPGMRVFAAGGASFGANGSRL